MSRSQGAAFLLLSGAALLLLRAAEQTPDALDYAVAAREGTGMWHPHHLIYTPLNRLIMLAIAPLAGPGRAILAAQIHNALWALVAIAAAFSLARRWLLPGLIAIPVVAALVATRGFLVYSTQGEPYLAATGCLLALAALVLPAGAAGRGPATATARFTFAVAGLLALAVLYHQASVLFVPALSLAMLTGGADRHGADRGLAAHAPDAPPDSRVRTAPWRRLLATLALAGIVVLVAYTAAYVLAGDPSAPTAARTGAGFLRYCLSYALAPVPVWGSTTYLTGEGLLQLLRSQALNLVATPERVAGVQAVLFGIVVLPLIGSQASLGLTGLWPRGRLARRQRARAKSPLQQQAGSGLAASRLALVVWVLSWWLFFLWWLPSDTDFFVTTLVPLVLLAGLAWADLPRMTHGFRGVLVVWMGVALLAAVNLWATVLPMHRSRGPAFAEAAALAAAAPAGAVILTDYAAQQNLRYYFPQVEPLHLDDIVREFAAEPQARIELAALRSRPVVLPADVLARQSPDGEAVESQEGVDATSEFLRWLLRDGPAGSRPRQTLAGDLPRPYVLLPAAAGTPRPVGADDRGPAPASPDSL
jgi:hypothetical protein